MPLIRGIDNLLTVADQRQMMCLSGSDEPQDTLMLSESGVYAMLVCHYCPENRHLRRWLTHHAVPMLRDGGGVASNQAPRLRLMEWAGGTLSLLHWRTETWVRLKDMPCLLSAGSSGARGF